MGIIAFTLFLLGLMLLIIYLAVMKKHNRCNEQTQGVLMKIGENRSRKATRYEYYYSYNVDGIAYEFKTFDRSPETNRVGDRCTIWYNPKKPKDALAHRYSSYKMFKLLLFGGIGLMVLALVLPFVSLALSLQ